MGEQATVVVSPEDVKVGDISVDSTRIMPNLALLLATGTRAQPEQFGTVQSTSGAATLVACMVLFFIPLGSRMEFVSPQSFSTRPRLMQRLFRGPVSTVEAVGL